MAQANNKETLTYAQKQILKRINDKNINIYFQDWSEYEDSYERFNIEQVPIAAEK